MDHWTVTEIDDASQYATVYCDGSPMATVQRKRVMETGPAWILYATDGKRISSIWGSPRKDGKGSGGDIDYARLTQWIIRRVQNALVQGRI